MNGFFKKYIRLGALAPGWFCIAAAPRMLLCVLCSSAVSAIPAFGQGVEIKTSDTSTDIPRFRIPTSGGVGVDANIWFQSAKVGIGTATPDALLTIGSSTSPEMTLKVYSEADAALHLVADFDNVTETDNAYILLQQDNAATDAFIGLVGNTGFDPRNVAYTGTLANHLLLGSTAVGDGVQIGSAGSVKMTVATGGNVGIGETSPAQTLDVNGTVRVQALRGMTLSGAATTNATFAAWPGFGAPVSWLYLSNGDTAAPAYTDLAVGKQWTSGPFYAANSDIYFNKTNHNHSGIGNTAGYAAIENSSDYNTLMILGRSGGIGGVRSVSCWDRFDLHGLLVDTGNTTQTSAIFMAFDGASYLADWPAGWGGGIATWDMCVGGIRYSALVARSDRRLKKNIEPLGDAFDRLERLRPVSFEWKDPRLGGRGRHFGFIAQEVEEVIPDLVQGTGDEMKSLNQQELTAFLVRGVQELDEALRKKRGERKALEARLEALEKALGQGRKAGSRQQAGGSPSTCPGPGGLASFPGCGR